MSCFDRDGADSRRYTGRDRMMEKQVTRLKHTIKNSTSQPQFVNFELSTQRYRLEPGQEMYFYYESDFPRPDEPPLITDFIDNDGTIEIVIWINFGSEDGPFLQNGEEAMTDWDPSYRP
jgi:hypothetical protein